MRALLEADRAAALLDAPPAPEENTADLAGSPAAEVEPDEAEATTASNDAEPMLIRAAPPQTAVATEANSPVITPASGNTLLAEPGRFHESDYQPTLAAMIAPMIVAEAPITLHRLARLVARRHGFQRTGREIVRVVRAVAEPLGQIASTPDGQEVIWGAGAQPRAVLPYRGSEIAGEARHWNDTPYPEKLGFAQDFVEHADAARAMSVALGLGRLAASTRDEFESLLERARGMAS